MSCRDFSALLVLAAACGGEAPRPPAEDVAGLGDLAFWGGNQLHVFTDGGWYLIVTPEPAGGLRQAQALAEKALAGL